MPILPLDHPEPLAATLGVMHYPGTNDDDPRKARAFAAQFLAEPIRRAYAEGHSLSYETLLLSDCNLARIYCPVSLPAITAIGKSLSAAVR